MCDHKLVAQLGLHHKRLMQIGAILVVHALEAEAHDEPVPQIPQAVLGVLDLVAAVPDLHHVAHG
jgi:hypothetical protein